MKVYLPKPKFIFSVLIHAAIYYSDAKLWGGGTTNTHLTYPVNLSWYAYVTIGYDGFAETSEAVEAFAVKEATLNSVYLVSAVAEERSAKYLIIGA